MEVKVKVGRSEKEKTEALVVGIFEGTKRFSREVAAMDKALEGGIRNALNSGDFKGKPNQVYLIHSMGKIPAARVVLTGLGKGKEFTTDKLRQAAGRSALYLSGLGLTSFATILHHEMKPLRDASKAVLEGCILGLYSFDKYKTNDKGNGKREMTAGRKKRRHGTGPLLGRCWLRPQTSQKTW